MDQNQMNDYEKLWMQIDRKENPADFWNQRASSFNQKSTTSKNRLTDTLEFILKKGLFKTDRVLDIGCATGKLAIKMGPYVAAIHGIDISPKMIQYAQENAAEEKAEHINFEVSTWAEVDVEEKGWEKAFDWTIASMTPAVQSIATLKKMIQASKKHCFISTPVHRENQLEQDLRNRFSFVKGRRDFTQSTRCIFNLLWLLGYTPEICYVDTTYTNAMTTKEVMHVFGINQLELEQQNQVQAYIEEISIDGKVTETVNTKISFIYWRVS